MLSRSGFPSRAGGYGRTYRRLTARGGGQATRKLRDIAGGHKNGGQLVAVRLRTSNFGIEHAGLRDQVASNDMGCYSNDLQVTVVGSPSASIDR